MSPPAVPTFRLACVAGAIVTAFALITLGYLPSASADGTLTMRGAYYKERSTRVVQPMLDADLDVGDSGTLQAHTLIDAITSASAASGAAGTPFTETRTQLGANYTYDLGTMRVGAGFRHSSEPDYTSNFLMLRFESDFAQRNTTFGLNLAQGSDSIDNSGSQGGISAVRSGELQTTMLSASLSQILSMNSVASISYDLIYLDGFQENIYRTVVAGGMVQPERVPETRLRQAMAASVRYYVEPTQTALIGSYRFYLDDWGILASTPEARAIQELQDGKLEVHTSYRYHRQRAAEFYKTVYDSSDAAVEPYVTDDEKLSRVRTHTVGLKLAASLDLFGIEGEWSRVRVEALGQYLHQNTRFGNAIVSQLALVVPIEY